LLMASDILLYQVPLLCRLLLGSALVKPSVTFMACTLWYFSF
jgi:hypothetical protein